MIPFPKLHESTRVNISEYGQAIIGVGRGDTSPPFVYSIGNHEKGLPELLLIGGFHGPYVTVVNLIGSIMRDRGTKFTNGEIVDFKAKYPVKLIDASELAKTEYTVQAGQYYETEDYDVMQILLADPMGVFPDDPACAEAFRVPVLLKPIVKH